MVIGNLSQRTFPIHLIAMYMTIIRMVVDAQDIPAFRKLAFPAGRRCSYFFRHFYSYLDKPTRGKAVDGLEPIPKQVLGRILSVILL